jgi:hypothetical protein
MELCIACVPAAAGAVLGYCLYKAVPYFCAKIYEWYNRYYYKTITITMSQNKTKLVNVIKFLSATTKRGREYISTLIMIDNVDYEVPLDEVDIVITVKGQKVTMKVNVDDNSNIIGVTITTLRGVNYDKFEKFMEQFTIKADDKKKE